MITLTPLLLDAGSGVKMSCSYPQVSITEKAKSPESLNSKWGVRWRTSAFIITCYLSGMPTYHRESLHANKTSLAALTTLTHLALSTHKQVPRWETSRWTKRNRTTIIHQQYISSSGISFPNCSPSVFRCSIRPVSLVRSSEICLKCGDYWDNFSHPFGAVVIFQNKNGKPQKYIVTFPFRFFDLGNLCCCYISSWSVYYCASLVQKWFPCRTSHVQCIFCMSISLYCSGIPTSG